PYMEPRQEISNLVRQCPEFPIQALSARRVGYGMQTPKPGKPQRCALHLRTSDSQVVSVSRSIRRSNSVEWHVRLTVVSRLDVLHMSHVSVDVVSIILLCVL